MKKIFFALLFVTCNVVAGDRVSTGWFVPLEIGSDYNGPVYVVAPEGIAEGTTPLHARRPRPLNC